MESIQLGTRDSVGLKTGFVSFSFLCAWSQGALGMSELRSERGPSAQDTYLGDNPQPFLNSSVSTKRLFSFAGLFPHVPLASLIPSQFTGQLMTVEINYL